MDILKKTMDIVKDKSEQAFSRTPQEKALHNTLSGTESIANTSEMSFIADQTNYYEESKQIMKAIQKKLKSSAGLRSQTRALEQVEYLIKNGTMRIVHEMNDEKHQIRSVKNQYSPSF